MNESVTAAAGVGAAGQNGGVYRERPSALPGAVVWTGVSGPGSRILPDGCMDLMWRGGRLLVAGPDSRAYVHEGSATYTGLRLPPGAAPLLLGVPADALRDQRVPLDDIWSPRRVRPLEQRLAASPAPGLGLEQLVADLVGPDDPRSSGVRDLVEALDAGVAVADAAVRTGFSARQLHRRCLAAFGYGPKVLARILRMQRALAQVRAGTPGARAAADSGYADQPHLARDVRALTGTTLGALAGAGAA